MQLIIKVEKENYFEDLNNFKEEVILLKAFKYPHIS